MYDSSPTNESVLRFMDNSLGLLSDDAIELGLNIIIAFVLLILIVFCVVGNLFVILAIVLERDLRSRPQYYLIFSLAVADLLVGLIVTPLGAWNTILGAWNLGVTLCDFWISVDVLLCTASILHLVAIALDRYWSITDIYYVQNRTPKRVILMLTVIWVVSIIISLAPIFGWKDAQFVTRVQEEHVCLISQQISYQVFSTATAFYVPLIVIIILYWKIMRAARKRFRRDRDRRTISRAILDNNTNNSRKNTADHNNHPSIPVPDSTRSNSINPTNGTTKSKVKFESTTNSISDDERTPMPLCDSPMVDSPNGGTFQYPKKSMTVDGKSKIAIQVFNKKGKPKKRIKESVETRRERKAWRTLAIITGTFVACWTPFFLLSLYRPLCGCRIPPLLESVTLWLGYLNSTLNPVIYTLFSVDFRLAFQRIIKRMCFMKEF